MTRADREPYTHIVFCKQNEHITYAALSKPLLLRPGVAYSVAGKVNSADKLYLGAGSTCKQQEKYTNYLQTTILVDLVSF